MKPEMFSNIILGIGLGLIVASFVIVSQPCNKDTGTRINDTDLYSDGYKTYYLNISYVDELGTTRDANRIPFYPGVGYLDLTFDHGVAGIKSISCRDY